MNKIDYMCCECGNPLDEEYVEWSVEEFEIDEDEVLCGGCLKSWRFRTYYLCERPFQIPVERPKK